MKFFIRAKSVFISSLILLVSALHVDAQGGAPEGMSLNAVGAGLQKEGGKESEAVLILEQSVALLEKSLGSKNPQTAIAMDNLASSYSRLGDFAKALPLQEKALAAFEESQGENEDTAITLDNLAGTHCRLGNYAKALPLQKRALAIFEQLLGDNHPTTGECLSNLAQTYCDLGEYEKALPLQKRALAITEEVLGSQHPNRIIGLNALGANLLRLRRYDEAALVLEEAKDIAEQALSPRHPLTASSLSNLAACYAELGKYQKAVPLLEKALEIKSEIWGPQHPETITTMSNLAVIAYEQGDTNSALGYVEKLVAAKQKNLRTILSLDEDSRLSWQAQNVSYWYACVLPPVQLAEIILRWKGVVLDSLIEDQALALCVNSGSEGRNKLQLISQLRKELAKIAFRADCSGEAAGLEDEIGRIQRELSPKPDFSRNTRSALETSIDQLGTTLVGGSVLVDFVRFHDPKGEGKKRQCYSAAITDEVGNSAVARVEDADGIDDAIGSLRRALTEENAPEVEEQIKFLSQNLWRPLAERLPSATKRLIICPDGYLSFLSFACLLGADGRFVSETYAVSYVGSGRSLVRKGSSATEKTMAVFADPAFDQSSQRTSANMMVAMRSAEADVFGTINLPALPGTKAEAHEIETIAKQLGWDIGLSTGEEATESKVREIKKPGVLHLATHGFYLNSFTPASEDGTRGMSVVGLNKNDNKQNENGVDPMRASGVALSGAQQTLKLWSQRKVPDPDNDGILTAEEVASLDLDGTWLVTLSACETGVGKARSGEGVFGLRRAFMIAGAENLLMTLWPVADDTTANIMADFYKEALATGDAPGSLAKVQRDWLVKLREEKGLATAIREAGPFAMVMMTAPTHPPVELPQTAKQESAGDPRNQPATDTKAKLTPETEPQGG